VAGLAAAAGRPANEVLFDLLTANDGSRLLYVPLMNYARGGLDDSDDPEVLGPARRPEIDLGTGKHDVRQRHAQRAVDSSSAPLAIPERVELAQADRRRRTGRRVRDKTAASESSDATAPRSPPGINDRYAGQQHRYGYTSEINIGTSWTDHGSLRKHDLATSTSFRLIRDSGGDGVREGQQGWPALGLQTGRGFHHGCRDRARRTPPTHGPPRPTSGSSGCCPSRSCSTPRPAR
jgi:hypothetical protein